MTATTKRDRVGEALSKHKAFFAFSTDQFNEQKEEGVKYISLGAGMIAPKETYKQLIKDMNQASSDNIADDLNQNGKKKIIHRELANHEASYTHSIEQTVEALEGYGISAEEVQAEFGSYLDAHYKWEEEQEAKAAKEKDIKNGLYGEVI